MDFLNALTISWYRGLSQNLETGYPKLAIVKYLGVLLFNGDYNLLRLQP